MPGVNIIALNVDQGLKREAWTDQSGSFSIPLLQPGNYVVSAEKQGFAILEVTDLLLHVGDARTLQLVLPVAKVRIQIRVNDRTGGVETVNPTLGQVVTGNVIRDAPLEDRTVLDLALLQPGVLPVNADAAGITGFSITGNREDSVTFLLDGAHNNNLLTNAVTYAPNPDTISEFRVLTSNYTADYGRNGGGIITLVTKSGTNSVHGTAFEFLRNEVLNANTFFNKNNGQPRPVLKRNQFGGTLGGPLALPFKAREEHRAFFFVSYQGTRQTQDISSGGTTFTPEEIQGDFSHAQKAACPQPSMDGCPDQGVVNFLEASPFFLPPGKTSADAVIDPSKFNTVAKNYIQAGLIPAAASGQVVAPEHLQTDSNELTARFDLELSSKDRVSLTLGENRTRFVDPFPFADVPGYPTESKVTSGFANGSYVRMFSPTLLNELRLGVQRSLSDNENPLTHLPRPQDLGMLGVTPDRPTGPPALSFDSGLAVGFSLQGPSQLVDNTFSVGDTLTWTRSRHTWKLGGGISAYQNNTAFAFLVDGLYTFTSDGSGAVSTGNDLANFLVGLPTAYQQGPDAHSNIRNKATNAFLLDEWRILPHLVLTLGLRYEYSTPKSDTSGRTFSIIPGQRSQVFPKAPVGLVFPGDPGAPRGVNFPDKKDFAPRFGFAWDITGKGKTSLRGGAGVFYNIVKADDNLQFNGQPPFYSSAGIESFPDPPTPLTSEVNYLAQPFAATGRINPFPSKPPSSNIDFKAAGFLPFGSSGSIFVVDPHLRTPYIYQYNLSLQHDLGSNTVLELSYAGSSSRKLTTLVDVNPFQLGSYDRVLNTFPGNSSCSVADSEKCSFGQILEYANASSAQFHSLEASLRKEVSHNRWFGDSYFTLAYTYSHNIDNASGSSFLDNRNTIVPSYNHDRFRASSDFDLRHRLVFSGGWKLPFGEVWSSAPKRLTHGWRVFPLIKWRTGFPIDVFANLAAANNFASPGPSAAGDIELVHANLIAPLRILDPRQLQTLDGVTGHFLFDPASFTATFPPDVQTVSDPGSRTYGNLPRNFFRGTGSIRADMAIAKETALWGEHLNGEFRADFFNLLNHTNFADPYTNINNPDFFGQTLFAGDPRVVQLSMRLTF